MNFEKGRQPCQNFVAQRDGNAYAEWNNVHQCYKCGGLVSFCESCCTDHHDDGYETCTEENRLKNLKEEEEC